MPLRVIKLLIKCITIQPIPSKSCAVYTYKQTLCATDMRVGSALTTRPPPQAESPGRGVMPTAYPAHTKVVSSRRAVGAVKNIIVIFVQK